MQQLVDELRSGAKTAANVEPIRVFEMDGILYTLDNRRLLAFQTADKPIAYRMATTAEVIKEAPGKMTTNNQGASVKVRGVRPK